MPTAPGAFLDAASRDAALRAEPSSPDGYRAARALSGKSIGHTSVVFKLKLAGGLDAAWKPRSKRGPTRYKGEVAAYRLGLALGLPNVPVAVPRSFPRDALLAALGGNATDAGALFEQEAVADSAAPAAPVPGALIPWLPHLGFMALEAEPLAAEWRAWLAGAADVPADKTELASQISTMIVFDYITGNWDRWSGGNIGVDGRPDVGNSPVLLFIDNDGAFYEAPPTGALASQKARLTGITRFSRKLVLALRSLDAQTFEAAMGEEAGGVPLLTEKAMKGAEARRETALKLIDRQIESLGAARVLAFE